MPLVIALWEIWAGLTAETGPRAGLGWGEGLRAGQRRMGKALGAGGTQRGERGGRCAPGPELWEGPVRSPGSLSWRWEGRG